MTDAGPEQHDDLDRWIAAEVQALAARLREHAQIDTLRTRLAEIDAARAQLASDLAEARSALDATCGELDAERVGSEAARLEAAAAAAELEAVRQRLQDDAARADAARTRASALEHANEQLQQALADAEARADRAIAEAARAGGDLEAADARYEQERTRCDLLTARIAELETTGERLKAALAEAQQQADAAGEESARTAAELAAARERARQDGVQADALATQLATTQAENERLAAAADAAERSADAVRVESAHVSAELSEAHGQLTEVRERLQQEQSRIETMTTRLSALEAENQRLQQHMASSTDAMGGRIAAAEAERTRLQETVAGLERQLEAARADVDAQRIAAEAARADVEAGRIAAEAARAQIVQMRAEFDDALEELRQEHAAVVGEQAVAFTSLPLDGLLTVFSALERATAMPELLSAMVTGLGREFSRVALFHVRGNRLEGAVHSGLDVPDFSKVAIPLTADSLLAKAAKSRQLESLVATAPGDADAALPFGGTPSCAVAIPLSMQNETVAMIYADDCDAPEFSAAVTPTRMKFAELLRQHADLALLKMWVEQRRLAELREFATMLVNELSYAHSADTGAGLSALECQHRLRNGVEVSRRIYAQRVAPEDAAAAGFFEEQLAGLIEAQGDSALGRDLSAVLGPAPAAAGRGRVVSMRR